MTKKERRKKEDGKTTHLGISSGSGLGNRDHLTSRNHRYGSGSGCSFGNRRSLLHSLGNGSNSLHRNISNRSLTLLYTT